MKEFTTHSFKDSAIALSAEEVRLMETFAFHENNPSEYAAAMKAGNAVHNIAKQIAIEKNISEIVVICGSGKNGADGLIAAGLLKINGFLVSILSALDKNVFEMEFAKRCGCSVLPLDPVHLENILDNAKELILIDALFGIGLKDDKNLPSEIEEIIILSNEAKNVFRISVDIPSGISASTGKSCGVAFKADITVTFHSKKVGHLLMPGKKFAGKLIVSDIGISSNPEHKIKNAAVINRPSLWSHIVKKTDMSDNKYSRGHCAIFATNRLEMTGASKMTAEAASRISGACSIICKPDSLPVYQNVPACIMKAVFNNHSEDLKKHLASKKVSAFAIGPGMPIANETKEITLFSLSLGIPGVVDAGSLSVFANNPEDLFSKLRSDILITPHEGEFAKLFNFSFSSKAEAAIKAAKTCGATVLIKGYDTVIASPDGRVSLSEYSSTALASAGTGDFLSGIAAGILSLSGEIDAFSAAQAASYIHVQCAKNGGFGMNACDIFKSLPEVLKHLQNT